jgi:putative ABC transport system permease protein
MSIWRIIFANLKFSRRQHLGTCLGLSVSTMLLLSALCIGDSIQATLTNQARERTGSVSHIFLSEEGYFYSDLVDRVQRSINLNTEVKLAPVLLTQGTVSSPNGKRRASGITVLGIDSRFFGFSDAQSALPDLNESGFWASPALWNELKMDHGSRLILRVEEPSLFSRDAPLSGERDSRFISWNRPLQGAIEPIALGNFSLRASMSEARTLFVPLGMLQEDMFVTFDPKKGRSDFCNLILADAEEGSISHVEEAIRNCWTLGDAGLSLKKLTQPNIWNLRSRSVFLTDRLVETAKEVDENLRGELTYLVNAIRMPANHKLNETSMIPYSMVTGVTPEEKGVLGKEWKSDEIAVNKWAAEDLNLILGDFISLEYFRVGEKRHLIEENRTFRVAKILPMPDPVLPAQESDWTPNFPGLLDAENCGEWDTGIPIKHKIRKQDEDYWDHYRGTPKAFISLDTAQEMWGNRWGKVTGLRIKGEERVESLRKSLLHKLSPKDFGLRRIDLKLDSEKAVQGPVDFSQLFMGFGFFVILAGVSLSAMLFGFSLEQRNRQVGLLRSLGFTQRRIRLICWVEAGFVCLGGTLLGVGWSWFFGQAILWMLNDIWGAAVAQMTLMYSPSLESLVGGLLGSFLMGVITLTFVSRKQLKRAPAQLLQSGEFFRFPSQRRAKTIPFSINLWSEGFLWICTFVLLGYSIYSDTFPGPSYFGIGALCLAAGVLRMVRRGRVHGPIKNDDLLVRLDFRSGRKIATAGLLAVGTFLVLGAGAFRQDPLNTSKIRISGTGGFSHIIHTSLPLYDDLLGEEAAELFDLNPSLLEDIEIIPLRNHGGDDASCLNLHQSTSPPLYGLSVHSILGKFKFVEGNWSDLQKPYPNRIVPAVVDQNTLLWSLKKRVGDRIPYLDGKGEKFAVEICAVVQGSFLQGALYISEKDWLRKFPQRGGYQQFWLGGEGNETLAVAHLEDRLLNYGVKSESTMDRLKKLKQVENTYLSIFQALGALGVLLGTVGLFVVMLRNLWERREEQGILSALGYSLRQLKKIYYTENVRVVFFGIILGAGAGFMGLVPSFIKKINDISYVAIGGFVLTLLIFAWLCLKGSILLGLKIKPFDSLKNE